MQRVPDEVVYQERMAGESFGDIAARYGIAPSSARRQFALHRLKLEADAPKTSTPLFTGESMKPLPPLTDIQYIQPDTDQGTFLERLHAARDKYGYVSVMHACDIHFPFHNVAALEVFYQLYRHVQPTFCAVGSDAADFALLSTFERDPDEHDGGDVLDEFDAHYTPFIHRLRRESPDTTLFFLLGNHELRIYNFIMRLAPQVRATVWRRFVEIVRCGGAVHWLGETDSARLGPLLVTHGNRTTIHAAKSMLEDAGYQISLMAGHVHRLTEWTRRGEDFPIVGVTSGCLCNYPHYMKRKRMARKWQLGTAIADVDLRGREVRIDNLEFQVEPDRIWVRYERELFEAQTTRPDGLLTYAEYLGQKAEAQHASV